MVELDPDQIFLIALLIVLAMVVYFELRFMRSRNKEYVQMTMDKDDAYNIIATTRSIATALKQKGRDTREAELVIIQAEQSYKRGNFISSRESAKKARDILINAPMIDMGIPIAPKSKDPEETSEEDRKTVQEVRKMEPNLMESRFIINSCRDRLQAEEGSGKDLTIAKEHLARAETCFEEKKYGEALREGMRARRIVSETSNVQETITEVPLVKVTKPSKKCPKCGNSIAAEDVFCRKCGAPIKVSRTCAYCQAELAVDDVFCPKCGRRA
ncbi:MAG: zinc ribbon domain-containing protein [Methanomassiliicoccales archaeon]|nr:zinc ribbon domain-containing protein [Methanomassiliicoccales archaeon]